VVERVAKAFEESHEDSNSEACSNHVRAVALSVTFKDYALGVNLTSPHTCDRC
jgi:hypothetical protein